MPHYEYHCPSNGRTIEVRHGMNERLATWGEVVGRAGLAVDGTPADSLVERLMSAPIPATAPSNGSSSSVGCGASCACARPG